MNITASFPKSGWFGRGVRNLFYILGTIIFLAIIYAWYTTDDLPDASKEALDNKDHQLFVDTTKRDVGSRVHYRGQLFIITKVVLQNATDWVSQNRIYYREQQGPRGEKNYNINVETPIPTARNFEFFYAYYGRPID